MFPRVRYDAAGVYWVPAYNRLEAAGFEVVLLNPRSLKGIPGKIPK
jgi:transposase